MVTKILEYFWILIYFSWFDRLSLVFGSNEKFEINWPLIFFQEQLIMQYLILPLWPFGWLILRNCCIFWNPIDTLRHSPYELKIFWLKQSTMPSNFWLNFSKPNWKCVCQEFCLKVRTMTKQLKELWRYTSFKSPKLQ